MRRSIAAVLLLAAVAGCLGCSADSASTERTDRATVPGPSSAPATVTHSSPGPEKPPESTALTDVTAASTAGSGPAVEPGATPSVGDPAPSSAPESSTGSPVASGFTPAPEAEAQPGDCPYLSRAEVERSTGERTGPARVRPAQPYPVCEFVRADGDWLATVRVLQLPTERLAVEAVDFYVPRDSSNPESKPAGWSGGSMVTADGSIYGVSKSGTAVVALSNQDTTIASRQLALGAITNLGL